MYHLAQLLLVEMESLEHFCPGWPQTKILLIYASQLARITGVNSCAQLFLVTLFNMLSLYEEMYSGNQHIIRKLLGE
jgi:hypothetical protein